MKEILKRIKEIVRCDDDDEYRISKKERSIALEGIKRLIYGIWNDGFNEKEENMIEHMNYEAAELYYSLIRDYKNTPKIEIHLSDNSNIKTNLDKYILEQDDETLSRENENEMLGVQTNDIMLWIDDDWSVSLECSHVNGQDTNGRDEIWCYFNNTLLCTFDNIEDFKQWYLLTTKKEYI